MGLFDGMYPVLISTASGKKYPDTRQGREQLDRDEGRFVQRYGTQPQDNFCPNCGANMNGGSVNG